MIALLQRLAGTHSLRETLGGTALTIAITGVGAVVSFLMFSLAARWLGPEEFGRFSAWFSAASFLAVVANLGQETLIVRTWAEYMAGARPGLARGAVLFGLGATLGGSIAVVAALLAAQAILGLEQTLALAAALFVVTQATMHFTTNSSHNIVGTIVGQGSADVSWRLLVLAAMLLPVLPAGWRSAALLLVVAALAQLALVAVQLGAIYKVAAPKLASAAVEMRPAEWRGRGARMWAAAIVEASSQYLDVVIVSILIDPVTAGAYFAATRVANLFARVSSAMAAFARQRIAPLYFAGRMDELRSLARSMALVTLAVVAVGIVVVLVLGKPLLAMFGPRFTEETRTLFILTLGTAAMALVGAGSVMLQHTGNEGLYARIIGLGFAGRTLLIIALAPTLGTEGAALAWSIAAVVTAVAVTTACRARIGIDPSPMILLEKNPAAEASIGAASQAAAAPAVGAPAKAAAAPADRLRVLMVQTQAEAAGAQEISRLLGEGLVRRGFEVHHAFLYRRTATLDFLDNTVYCADQRPSGPPAVLAVLWRLWRHCRRIRPTAVCTFQHYGNMLAGPVARAAGIRSVIATRTTSSMQLPFWLEILDVHVSMSSAFARIVVNSRETEREVARYPWRFRRKVVRIDHGFGTKASGLEKGGARQAFALPAGVPLLGCVARLHPQKNQAAAIQLLAVEPTWHLALAGQGQDRDGLEALALELGCADRLHFVGEITPQRVGDFLAALDVFVFPSLAESFGLAPVEAAQVGVPVVANALPVLQEVLTVEGRACAAFVDVADTAAFASVVRRMIAGGPEVQAMTSLARRLAEKYSLEAMIDAYARMIGELAGSHAVVRSAPSAGKGDAGPASTT